MKKTSKRNSRTAFFVEFYFTFSNDQGDDVHIPLRSAVIQETSIGLASQWAEYACEMVAKEHDHPLTPDKPLTHLDVGCRVRRLAEFLRGSRTVGTDMKKRTWEAMNEQGAAHA